MEAVKQSPRLPLSAVLPACLLALSCQTSTQPERAIYTLQVSPPSASIAVGDSLVLGVRAYDVHTVLVTDPAVTYESDNPSVATVSATGVVRGVARGTATITVTAGTLVSRVPVRVTGPPAAVRVSPARLRLLVGDTVALAVTVLDAAGDTLPNAAPSFTTSSGAVVAVSPLGLVTAAGTGTASLTVSAGSISLPVPVVVFQIQLTPQPASLYRDTTVQLGITVRDSTGALVPGAVPVLASADTTIATVTPGGLVSGVGIGMTTVFATFFGLTARVPVSVLNPYPLGGRPYSIALASTGLAYVTRLDSSAISWAHLPALTFSTDSATAVGLAPTDIAFNPAGTTAYVANQLSASVGVIDVATGREVATIPLGMLGNPFRVLVSSDGATVYVSTNIGTIVAVDATSRAVTVLYSAGAPVNGLALDPTRPMLYATSIDGGLYQLNTSTGTVSSLPLGGRLQEVVVSADGATLFLANESGPLLVVNAATGIVTSRLSAAGFAFAARLSPDGTVLALGSPSAGTVRLMTIGTGAVRTVTVGGTPRRMVWDPSGTRLLVANEAGTLNVVR